MQTHLVLYRDYQDMIKFNKELKESIEAEILQVTPNGLVSYYKYNNNFSPEMKLIYCEGVKEKVITRLGGESITSCHYLEGDYDSFVMNYVMSRWRRHK